MRYVIDSQMPAPPALTDVERAEHITAYAKSLAAAWKGKRPPRIPRIPENPTFEIFSAEPAYEDAIATPYNLPIG